MGPKIMISVLFPAGTKRLEDDAYRLRRAPSDVTDNGLTYLPSAFNVSYAFIFISLCSFRVKTHEFTGQLKCSLYPWGKEKKLS